MSYISAAQAKQIAQKAVDNLKDGTLVPKLADNLTPYAEDSGTTQTQPFFLEGTATGNGESRVDAKQVPAFAFLQEKRGNMVCVNQLVRNGDFSTTSNWTRINSSFSVSDNVGTFTATAPNGEIYQGSIPRIKDHKYLVNVDIKLTTGGDYLKIFAGGQIGNSTSTTNWQSITVVYTSTSTVTGTLDIQDQRASGWDAVQIKNVYFVDLTQWFNGNIPAYLLSHPEAFGRYYKGPLAYEPGRLEPATSRYLTSVGRNIWDEEWESGYFDAQGQPAVSTNYIRSKNYIEVMSNATYYFKRPTASTYIVLYDESKNVIERVSIGSSTNTYTILGNVQFIKFAIGGSGTPVTTYNHDITISLYYTGESGYNKYYPHEVLATIDTGTEQLGAFDYKIPSGLITRNTGNKVFAGNETWGFAAGFAYTTFDTTSLPDSWLNDGKAICSNGIKVTLSSGRQLRVIFTDNPQISSSTNMNDIFSSGTEMAYELATPTTEQGTPFQENVPIDDFGQLSWSNTDVPQGNQIFYPVDYKAYDDTLIKYTDGDATSLVRKTDYASSSEAGVVKVGTGNEGVAISPSGLLSSNPASKNQIKDGVSYYPSISAYMVSTGVFYGLAKAAGANLNSSSAGETAPAVDGSTPGVYPASAIQAILKMLLPAAPTTDGTYDLVCTVTNGEPTFSWVART